MSNLPYYKHILISLLVSCGCFYKWPPTEWLKTTGMNSLSSGGWRSAFKECIVSGDTRGETLPHLICGGCQHSLTCGSELPSLPLGSILSSFSSYFFSFFTLLPSQISLHLSFIRHLSEDLGLTWSPHLKSLNLITTSATTLFPNKVTSRASGD